MNTAEKIKFIAAMTKYSLVHPDCAIEFINWYSNTRKDKSRTIHTYSKSFKNTKDILQKLFPNGNFDTNFFTPSPTIVRYL